MKLSKLPPMSASCTVRSHRQCRGKSYTLVMGKPKLRKCHCPCHKKG